MERLMRASKALQGSDAASSHASAPNSTYLQRNIIPDALSILQCSRDASPKRTCVTEIESSMCIAGSVIARWKDVATQKDLSAPLLGVHCPSLSPATNHQGDHSSESRHSS